MPDETTPHKVSFAVQGLRHLTRNWLKKGLTTDFITEMVQNLEKWKV